MVILYSPKVLKISQDIFPKRKGQKTLKGGTAGHILALISSYPGGKANPEGRKRVRNMKGWLWGLRGTLAYNLV